MISGIDFIKDRIIHHRIIRECVLSSCKNMTVLEKLAEHYDHIYVLRKIMQGLVPKQIIVSLQDRGCCTVCVTI